jgi:hypothetical protein
MKEGAVITRFYTQRTKRLYIGRVMKAPCFTSTSLLFDFI